MFTLLCNIVGAVVCAGQLEGNEPAGYTEQCALSHLKKLVSSSSLGCAFK